jgi:aquaporin Z
MKDSFKKYLAEFIGTFILVAVGVGAAVAGAGFVGTALAFGAAIIILAYSVGRISGGHVNPAVSLAMAIRGDITWKEFCGYTISQILGALVGSGFVAAVSGGVKSTGANVVDTGTLGIFVAQDKAWVAYLLAFIVELVLTFVFVLAILGVTADDKFAGFGGLVIGLALTGVHLVGDGVTNTSVNPARSLSAAIFAAFGKDTTGLKEIWIFILAPLAGAALAAFCWKFFASKKEEKKSDEEAK